MKSEEFQDLQEEFREESLSHRYIKNENILPLINNLGKKFITKTIGFSKQERFIKSVTFGKGPKKILIWSQMHGNESTTTKALFDVFNVLSDNNELAKSIEDNCTLKIIPILNPDGAELYSRLNANGIDLNRDAQNLTQRESRILRELFIEFSPNYCFNLHGQRTIFSAGNTSNSATMSFLAPAQDEKRTITNSRKLSMDIIVQMNNTLQQLIPYQVGIYDDSFNINCVGDTFQSESVPTILFEAGHYYNDYARDKVRDFVGVSLLSSLHYIAKNVVSEDNYEPYLNIPRNEKCLYDVIIRNARLNENSELNDVAFQYQEVLVDTKVEFLPKLERIDKLPSHFGHFEFDAEGEIVETISKEKIFEGYENDFVLINNELFALNRSKS